MIFQFRKKERSFVPEKYLSNRQENAGPDYLTYIEKQPEECDAKIVITIKSSADHFGTPSLNSSSYCKLPF
jgi:hypothetical protein